MTFTLNLFGFEIARFSWARLVADDEEFVSNTEINELPFGFASSPEEIEDED